MYISGVNVAFKGNLTPTTGLSRYGLLTLIPFTCEDRIIFLIKKIIYRIYKYKYDLNCSYLIFYSSICCMYKKMCINITFFSAKKDNIKCCIPQWWNYLYRSNCDNETHCILLTLFYTI